MSVVAEVNSAISSSGDGPGQEPGPRSDGFLEPFDQHDYSRLSIFEPAPSQAWEAVVRERFVNGIDLSSAIPEDTRAAIFADTNHKNVVSEAGFIGLLPQLKELGFTHLALEISSDLTDESLDDVAILAWNPHRLKQLVLEAQEFGIEVEFVDLASDDPRRARPDVDEQRGVGMGEAVAGILESDPANKVAVLAGSYHAADPRQISAPLVAGGHSFVNIATVAARQRSYLSAELGSSNSLAILAVTDEIARVTDGQCNDGYLTLDGQDADFTGVMHFAPITRGRREIERPVVPDPNAGTTLVVSSGSRMLAPISTELTHPLSIDYSQAVEPHSDRWQDTNREKVIDMIMQMYRNNDIHGSELLYLGELLVAFLNNPDRGLPGVGNEDPRRFKIARGSLQWIDFEPHGQYFKIALVDTAGYAFDHHRNYGVFESYTEISIAALKERYGFEHLISGEEIDFTNVGISNNPARPEAVIKFPPFLHAAVEAPETISVYGGVKPRIRVTYFEAPDEYRALHLSELTTLEVEDFSLSPGEQQVMEIRDRLFHLDRSIADLCLRGWLPDDGSIDPKHYREWRGIYEAISGDFKWHQFKGPQTILQCRKELREMDQDDLRLLRRETERSMRNVFGAIHRLERLVELYPQYANLDFDPPRQISLEATTPAGVIAEVRDLFEQVPQLFDGAVEGVELPPQTEWRPVRSEEAVGPEESPLPALGLIESQARELQGLPAIVAMKDGSHQAVEVTLVEPMGVRTIDGDFVRFEDVEAIEPAEAMPQHSPVLRAALNLVEEDVRITLQDGSSFVATLYVAGRNGISFECVEDPRGEETRGGFNAIESIVSLERRDESTAE